MNGTELPIRQIVIDLGVVGKTTIENFEICSWCVETMTGVSGYTYLSRSSNDMDPSAIPITPGKSQQIGRTGATTWYVWNRVAQTGLTLILTLGGPGTSVNPGYSTTSGSANAENQALQLAQETAAATAAAAIALELANQTSLAAGQVTVGATQVQLTAQAIDDGYEVCIKALVTNTGTIYLGVTGVLTSTGFELSAGESISLRITNLNLVYAIADAAAQKVCWIVEKAA